MHITLVGGFDRRLLSTGGVRPYVEALARYLEEAGTPHTTIVSGRELEFGLEQCVVPVRNPRSTFNFISSVAANLRSLPIPPDSIIHAQRPDLLLPFLVGGVGKTWVCTLHGNPLRGIEERGSRALYAGYAATEGWIMRRIHRVIFVDPDAATVYLRRYPWLETRSEVIPNAVDTVSFRPGDRPQAKRSWGFTGTVFLYAGRLQPEKRVVEIVKAFRDLNKPEALLVIAGEGRDEQPAKREAEGLNVRFLGPVGRSEMPSLMNASDGLVLFSTREGLPTVVLESLACGLPVITTSVGALRDVVHEGENGLLVDNRIELTHAMGRVCRGDISASQTISASVERYAWTKLGPQVLRAYTRAQELAESG